MHILLSVRIAMKVLIHMVFVANYGMVFVIVLELPSASSFSDDSLL